MFLLSIVLTSSKSNNNDVIEPMILFIKSVLNEMVKSEIKL